MTQDPEDALAQEAVEGRMRAAYWREMKAKCNPDSHPYPGATVVPFPVEVPFGEDPIAPDAQHLGG